MSERVLSPLGTAPTGLVPLRATVLRSGCDLNTFGVDILFSGVGTVGADVQPRWRAF